MMTPEQKARKLENNRTSKARRRKEHPERHEAALIRARLKRKQKYRENPEYRANELLRGRDPKKRKRSREYSRSLRADRTTWAKAALTWIRWRASAKGLPFDLTALDIDVPVTCPVLGTPLVFGGGKNHPDSPSVDRIIPELGYVRGNINVISNKANTLKRDVIDAADLEKVATYVRNCQRAASVATSALV